jgi:hypothetical protein
MRRFMSTVRARGAGTVLVALILCALAGVLAAAGLTAPNAQAGTLGFGRFEAQTTQGGQPPEYENEPYDFTQAGGHPFALSTSVEFAGEGGKPPDDPKDVIIDLPPGLFANPRAVSMCTTPEVQACPSSSQVGVFVIRVQFNGHPLSLLGPLVNLAPERGEAARLGLETPLGRFLLSGQLVYGQGGYGLALASRGLPTLGVTRLQITLWGVPAAAAHDAERGLSCLRLETNGPLNCSAGGAPSGMEEAPFLTLPSECSSVAPRLTAWADSWKEPGSYARASTTLPPIDGCNRLPFGAEVVLRPDSWQAEAPVALDVEIGLKQSSAPAGVAAAELRGASVTLPDGLTIDPSGAAGTRACAPNGAEGIGIPTGLSSSGQPLRPGQLGEGEQPGPGGEPALAPGHCPEASTIGTAEALSTLLGRPLQGRVYLAVPGCGGAAQRSCGEADAAEGNLLRIYIELGGRGEEHAQGVILKLEGRLHVSPATGQLTLELLGAPQLPLSHLSIKLFGGSDALLDNPTTCASVPASAELEPWSAPFSADLVVSSPYQASGCPNPAPFAPSLMAGSVNVEAGDFTAFTLAIGRAVREQEVAQLQLRAPAGIAAMLASVVPCSSAAASSGSCPSASRVGSSYVAVGGGYQPLWLDGDVYLTGGYEGAPFGLAIVTHGAAGPLELGRIVIRARLDVDPHTGALTITSDPLPRMVLGIPLRLRDLRLDIDRPGFILNPTDCHEQQVLASIASTQGVLASPSNPFGLADCKALRFAPKLTVSTSARTSIGSGASLDLRLSQAAGPGSGQANLAKLRIALPRSLPTRLTALQASCPAAKFATNAAACPAGSVIGVARASTPLLSGALLGPVYMVAHGRGSFPAPTVVLEGRQGLRLDLTGSTNLERGGRTAIAFSALPDMPLRSVELYLSRGPHSALTATANPCATRLSLPVELGAQNGIVIHRTMRIVVLGCRVSSRHLKR